MTKGLKRLEEKGFIEIKPNPENKSKNIVTITDKGRKVTQKFNRTIDSIENEIFEDYTPQEKEKLKIMLRDLSKKYYELSN
jgi:DNA-binding MarR family transcriptional regulator